MINGHGDDAYRYTAIHANFSSNVYHRVNHDGLNRYLAGCLPCIRSYPEPEPYALAAELARLHGVSPEEVCVTNGATEAIYLIAQAFCGSHSAVWIPTFSEYADACRLHGRIASAFHDQMLCRAGVASGSGDGQQGTSFPDTCLPYALVGQCLGRRSRTLPVAASGGISHGHTGFADGTETGDRCAGSFGWGRGTAYGYALFFSTPSAGYCGATEGILGYPTRTADSRF